MGASSSQPYRAKSSIHGDGLFADRHYAPGEKIGVAIEFSGNVPRVTKLGRWVNHKSEPNSSLLFNGTVYNLHAIRAIAPGEEITSNYNNAPTFIERAKPWYV